MRSRSPEALLALILPPIPAAANSRSKAWRQLQRLLFCQPNRAARIGSTGAPPPEWCVSHQQHHFISTHLAGYGWADYDCSMTAAIDLPADPIAFGRTAEVFAVGDDRVLKLLKPGFDPRMLSVEFAKTAAVHSASELAPAVYGLVDVDGRQGVLMERVFGVSMLDSIMSREDKAAGQAVVFADLHGEILGSPSGKDLPDVKEFMAHKIDHADLPSTQRRSAKDQMMGLPNGEATLHGDFHPLNVLITSNGPRAIDWGEASRGDLAADIARTLVLLTPESAAEVVTHPGSIASLVSTFADAYVMRCLQVTGATIETVAAWRLPVIAARLSEGITEQVDLLQAEVAQLTA